MCDSVVVSNMYELECDSCEFGSTVTERWRAYGSARDHESEYPSHTVFVHEREGITGTR